MIFEATIKNIDEDGVMTLEIDNDDSELIGLVGKKVTVSIQEVYQFDAGISTCSGEYQIDPNAGTSSGIEIDEIFYNGA